MLFGPHCFWTHISHPPAEEVCLHQKLNQNRFYGKLAAGFTSNCLFWIFPALLKKKKKIIISHLVLHDILDAFLNYPGECFNLSRCPELKQGILRFDTAKMMGLLWSCFLAHLLPLESKVSKEDKKVDLLYLPA